MRVKYSSWIINCLLNVLVCNIAEHFYSFYFSWFGWRARLKYSTARKKFTATLYTKTFSKIYLLYSIWTVVYLASNGFSKPAANLQNSFNTPFPLMRFGDAPFSFYQKSHRFLCFYASVFIGPESSNISTQSSPSTDDTANAELANSEAMPIG